jgi:hypothetical protein
VARSYRQRRIVGRELRDLAFRLCTIAGGFLGLNWALGHYHAQTRHATPGQCHGHTGHTQQTLTSCLRVFSSTLTSDILSFVIPVLIGLFVGAIVGCLIAVLIRTSRKPRSASTKPGRWIRARYLGQCETCGCSVVPGDRIRHRTGHVLCVSCGER